MAQSQPQGQSQTQLTAFYDQVGTLIKGQLLPQISSWIQTNKGITITIDELVAAVNIPASTMTFNSMGGVNIPSFVPNMPSFVKNSGPVGALTQAATAPSEKKSTRVGKITLSRNQTPLPDGSLGYKIQPKDSTVGRCSYKFTKGDWKGYKCGDALHNGTVCCKTHEQYASKLGNVTSTITPNTVQTPVLPDAKKPGLPATLQGLLPQFPTQVPQVPVPPRHNYPTNSSSASVPNVNQGQVQTGDEDEIKVELDSMMLNGKPVTVERTRRYLVDVRGDSLLFVYGYYINENSSRQLTPEETQLALSMGYNILDTKSEPTPVNVPVPTPVNAPVPTPIPMNIPKIPMPVPVANGKIH